MDEAGSVRDLCPPRSLDSARNLQGQLVEILLAFVEWNFSLPHQPPQISVGGDIVEPVVVHAQVRDMRGHPLNRVAPSEFEKSIVSGRVELQQRRAVLKSLRPFRPAA